ncbi:MAG: transcriptional regulator [Anaerolineaceae bacterium]|nr:transcriptional regulator [Anaerolineaceae bacterium]
MSEIFEEIVGLDKIIHEPARLAILTALSSCISADFTFLQRLTGLTQGNLSGHLLKLEEAKLIEINKKIVKKRPNTTIKLTSLGKKSIENHWKQLEELREKSRSWKNENQ